MNDRMCFDSARCVVSLPELLISGSPKSGSRRRRLVSRTRADSMWLIGACLMAKPATGTCLRPSRARPIGCSRTGAWTAALVSALTT